MTKREIINVIRFTIIFALALLFSSSAVFAEDENEALEIEMKPSGSEDTIILKSVDVGGSPYFFMPSGATEENMENVPDEETAYQIMNSANIASLHFFSSDPEKKIDYVHADKGNKAPGEVYMFDKDFNQIYYGTVDALKGRGNTTWEFTDKKSYQIKLDKKADLLEPQNGDQKAKKWILLANPFDPTLMRNYMIYSFGKEIGLENTPDGRPVDFYYDGEYRGSYYLCEKVEIGEGRVDIEGLEKTVEKVNPDIDFDSLNEVIGTTSKGIEAKYEEGIKDPDDITGGYLLELDHVYYKEEKSWFKYYDTSAASVKSPEYTSETMISYISEYLSDLYRYCKASNEGKNDGEKLPEMIDMDSFARFFLVNEWFGNNDIWTSSTFLYKPKGDERLYAGPVWDCDSTMSIRSDDSGYDKWFAEGRGLGGYLLGMPVFRQKLQEIYSKDCRPIIFDILLGTEKGEYLKPVAVMKDELAASSAMDFKIWGINDCLGSYSLKDTPEENYEEAVVWMNNRAEWLDKEIMSEDFVRKKADVYRLYGDTRYETSLKVANVFRTELGVEKYDSVILACGTNYADALAGSYLSSVRKAPILLVDGKDNHINAVKEYIQKHLKKDGTVYILGGSAVVPDRVVSDLDGFSVVRLGGKDRYETNILILREAAKYSGGEEEYLIVSGNGYADSLSASATKKPIILVKSEIQHSQRKFFGSLKARKFCIIGGNGAVSTDIENELTEYGKVERVGGATRYETSTEVAKRFFKKPEAVVLAYSHNFPDGLCGGSLACSMNAPILLAANGKTDAATEYTKKNDIVHGVILGGPALINDDSSRNAYGLPTGAEIVVK